jgi:hypothetical protein
MTTIDTLDPWAATAALDRSAPPLPASILAARAAIASATAGFLAIPDAALPQPWTWRDVENELRYGLYRAAETIEAASVELEANLAGAPARPPATRVIAASTIARWALHGRLASLADSVLDTVAKHGEWTVRQTLGHTVGGQRGYGWASRWWLSIPLGPDRPRRIPRDVLDRAEAELPSDDDEGVGTLGEIRSRLDIVLDDEAFRFAPLGADLLAVPATWSGTQVDIGFRLARWGSHIYEHTVQLDKTLAWLGHQPSEAQRIVRDIHTAWGRLESRIWPAASTTPAVDEILARMSATIATEAESVGAAARP